VNTVLRLILLLWVIGFLAISCAPLFNDGAVAGGLGLIVGTVLFIPWLIGLFILGALIWLTNRRRPR
jgi:hypothetical protein